MTQPLQTRRFKEALARLQYLFVSTPGVKLTTLDAAQRAGLDQAGVPGPASDAHPRRVFSSSAWGAYLSAARRIPTNRNPGGLKW